ncbi:MAG: hypothetical protein A4E56_01315 [Pelotomaculum sp. PtaU1.Bin065]|nr:MAG: hypothetical protein A4E56_01315 [Pelotomaculum sp. PtaU1.Bin065]
MYLLPEHNARGDLLHGKKLVAIDRTLAVQRLAQRVDHPANQGVAHRHRNNPAGALDGVALFNMLVRAENNTADVVFFQVEGHPQHAAWEFQQFHGHTIHQAVYPGDPVTDLDNGTHVGHFDLCLVLIYLLPDNRTDFFRSQIHSLVHPYL